MGESATPWRINPPLHRLDGLMLEGFRMIELNGNLPYRLKRTADQALHGRLMFRRQRMRKIKKDHRKRTS
jgi:hypothetical protein